MENPIKMDDLGVPPFQETFTYAYTYIYIIYITTPNKDGKAHHHYSGRTLLFYFLG
jgi:hypothetical protein